jgi:glycosyltransferase involved in cell wall biosynthesis
MKILHVSPMYFPALGGAELHLQKLSEGLAARGHHVTVLTANACKPWDLWAGRSAGLPEVEVIGAVRVRRFQPDGGLLGSILDGWWQSIPGGYRSSSLVFGKQGLELLLRKPFLTVLIPYLLGTNADIVTSVNWYWPPAYHVYLARKLKRFRLVGMPLFHLAESWCNQAIYTKMLAKCDAIVVNTTAEATFAQTETPIHAEVVGVGIEPSAFEHRDGRKIRARYGLGNHLVVGFVGRQTANKGVGTLLQAMKTVWNWNPKVRLVLAGVRPPVDREIGPIVEGLTDFQKERIVWINDFSSDEKASIYDSFDVFVLPSMGESFGIAYLEAWMCDKPVIGARIGPTQCVIEEGVDGLLAKPRDPEDTARAIIELLADSKKRQAMGRTGHAKTIAQYTWDKVTDKVERLYLDVKAARAADRPPFVKAAPSS